MGKIVIASQGLDLADDAFTHALRMAQRVNAEIVTLNAIDIDKTETHWVAVQQQLEEELKEQAKENIKAVTKNASVKIRSVVVTDPLDEAVTQLARADRDIDLIILSGRVSGGYLKKMQSKVKCQVSRYPEGNGKTIGEMIGLLAATIGIYILVFSFIDPLNKMVVNVQVLGGFLILGIAVLASSVYGSGISRLLKLVGIEAKH